MGTNNETENKGITDALGLGDYADTLKDYIKMCDTPTTIAIEGDWGCGKTNFVNMVLEKLNENMQSEEAPYRVITFNTWQYSQFDMGDSLSVTFLTQFLKGLEKNEKSSTKKDLKNLISELKALAPGIAKNTILHTVGKVGGDDLKEMATEAWDTLASESMDQIDVLSELKVKIEQCISSLIEEEKKYKKIVVFIDDLDRLEPVRAVELLEIIKIFLDCKGCVFLLAVDTAVIKQGIIQKHGLSDEKSQAFFDKLIQLPFALPVAQYNYNEFVKSIFPSDMDYENIFFGERDDKVDIDCYWLLRLASNRNPRAAKRIVNAFVLQDSSYRKHCTDKDEEKAWASRVLLAMVCIQMSLTPDYQTIMEMIARKRFFQWANSKDNLVVSEYDLKYKFGFTDSQIEGYTKDKYRCARMIYILKDWSKKYFDKMENKDAALENLLQSKNIITSECDWQKIRTNIQIVQNEFEEGLKAIHIPMIQDYLRNNKTDKEISEWYDDIQAFLDAESITQNSSVNEEMLRKIDELTLVLAPVCAEEEIQLIYDFFANFKSLRFKYAYSQVTEEAFVILKEQLTRSLEPLHRLEDKIKEKLEELDLFTVSEENEYFKNEYSRSRMIAFRMIEALFQKKMEALFKDGESETVQNIYDNIIERIQYFFLNVKLYSLSYEDSDKEYTVVSKQPLPSLFAVSIMSESTKEEKNNFRELKECIKGKSDDEYKEKIMSASEKLYSVWKKEFYKRQDLVFSFRKCIRGCELPDKWNICFKALEKQVEICPKEKPADYNAQQLKWYFSLTVMIANLEWDCPEVKEKLKVLREPENFTWKRVFRAVDIIINEYFKGAKENSLIQPELFGQVSQGAIEELECAKNNSDGWIYEGLPAGFEKLALEQFVAALQSIKSRKESPDGSYELGMSIAKYFDTGAYGDEFTSLVNGEVIYREVIDNMPVVFSDYCCFEVRENTITWQYYQVFVKVINQLRFFHTDLQKYLYKYTSCADLYVDPGVIFMNAEKDYEHLVENTHIYFTEIYKLIISKTSRGKDALADLKKMQDDAFCYLCELESAKEFIKWNEFDVSRYFETVGNIIYCDFPRFMQFVDGGVLMAEELPVKWFSNRVQNFIFRHKGVFDFLKDIMEKEDETGQSE